ncbi:hypothetical protein AVEN_162726-1, partial [Araneus ventricosus]
MLILCESIYVTLGNIIEAYGKRLQNKFRFGHYTRESLANEIEVLSSIVKQVELADNAICLCTMLLYGMFLVMFYITISMGISKEESFKTNLVTWFMVWNFIRAIYLFSRLTLNGCRVQKESKKLRNIGMECSRRIAISRADGPTLMTFSLLFANIKDANLAVTVGGM